MGSLSKREKILLALMAIAIVFYAYYSLFLSPTLNKMNASKANIQKYTVEVERVRNVKAKIESQKKEIEQLSAKLTESLKVLPDMERNPEIAFNIKKMADADTVTIASVGFGQPVEFKPPTASQPANNGQGSSGKSTNNSQAPGASLLQSLYIVPVTLSVSGDYNSLMTFINSLENDTRISGINTLGFAKSQDGKLSLNIGITYFYSNQINGDTANYDFNKGTYGKGNLFK